MKNKLEIKPVAGLCAAVLGMMLPIAVGQDQPAAQPAVKPVAEPVSPEVESLESLEAGDVFDAPDADDIAAMIKSLGDESYPVRKKATMGLWQLGSEVLPVLQKAAEGSDPESVDRASELVLYITAGVLFDSPAEVKELVLKYSKGDLKAKVDFLKKLKELRQWKQVLHLAKMEQDPMVRKKLSSVVKATASLAAQEAVVDGDLELAAEVLQLSGNDDQALVVRAWFYCSQGKFNEELKKAAAMPKDKGALWRLALYRAHGDLDDAIREAQKLGRTQLVAGMQVFAGDAQPWLTLHTDQGQQDAILSLSCQIQMARLKGDKKTAGKLERDLARLAVDDESAGRVISCLAANGFQNEALVLLEKFDADFAFEYFDSVELPARALAQFDIPEDAKPPYTQWVKKFTEQVIEAEDEDRYDRLLMVAGFLVRHGEAEHALSVIEPMMTALEEDGSDAWFDLIAKMPIYELGSQALHLIERRGNDDGEADLAIKKMLGSGKTVEHLWEAVKKRNDKGKGGNEGKVDIAKSLRDIALLAGLSADPEHLTNALHRTLMDEVAEKPMPEKQARHEALFSFAVRRHEIATASGMVDEVVANNEKWQATKLYLDATLQRWEKVEPVYAALEEEHPGDYFNLVKWSCALRKLKSEDKAKDVLDRAYLLTMGNVSELNKIGLDLSNAGLVQEAVSLWQKAAMMSVPGSTTYDVALVYLANASQMHVRKKQWKKAASIAEAYTRFTMRGRSGGAVMAILNARFRADFYRGMFLLESGRRKEALALLDSCQKLNPGSGSLADEFFPSLRGAGVDQQYNQWFEENYQHVAAACEAYPKAHNSHNTAAWLASRALQRLDDALQHAQTAIALRPYQGAYLDTMAEVWFAKEDRKKAIEWSKKAITASISHAQGAPRSEGQILRNYIELNKQLKHFKNDPLPSAKP